MRNWLQRFNARVSRLMMGRYGIDELGSLLLISGIVMSLLSLIRPLFWLAIPAFFIIAWSYFRCFSKNIGKRQSELSKYWGIKNRIRSRLEFLKKKRRDKTHKSYRCKLCKTVLRVPKGRGKIQITCPKCKNRMIKKT